MKILIMGAEDVVTNLSATSFIRDLAINDINEIDMLICGNQQPLFITNPDIGKIYIFKRKLGNRWYDRFFNNLNILKILIKTRHKKYDFLFYLNQVDAHQKNIWKIFSGVKSTDSIINSGCAVPLTCNNSASQHAEPYRLATRKASLKLYPDLNSVSTLARRYCISLRSFNIGIVVNSVSTGNRPPGEWVCLIRKLAKHGRIFLIISEDNAASSDKDMAFMALVESLCSDLVMTVVVTTSTAELIAMISLCSRLISADIDSAWIAASLNVPVIYPESRTVADVPSTCFRISNINTEEILVALDL